MFRNERRKEEMATNKRNITFFPKSLDFIPSKVIPIVHETEYNFIHHVPNRMGEQSVQIVLLIGLQLCELN